MHKGSQEWVAGLAQSLKGLGPEVEPPILAQAPAGLVGVVSPVLRVSFCVSFYISLSLWLPYLFLARSPLALSAAQMPGLQGDPGILSARLDFRSRGGHQGVHQTHFLPTTTKQQNFTHQ